MPLANIKCMPKSYPAFNAGAGTKAQQVTEQFGESLPALFVDNKDKLLLEADTPPEAVQVDFEKFHPKAVNAPDMWIQIKFSEIYPGKKKAKKVRKQLKQLFTDWFESRGLPVPSMSVDCFWGPTHGYLAFGSTEVDW